MEVKDLEYTSGVGIKAVSFGYFKPEEQRALSVKRITRSVTFDRLGRSQREGLYDPSLGPIDPLERCETCSQSYDDCPGHYGHIDLSLPTFHPLLFNELYKLLRCCCFQCNSLRMNEEQVAFFTCVLSKIREGKLAEASDFLLSESSLVVDSFNPMELDHNIIKLAKKEIQCKDFKFESKTQHQQELWNLACSMFTSAIPKKCAHCSAASSTLKKDGYIRILKKPLSKRQRVHSSKAVKKGKGDVKEKGKETKGKRKSMELISEEAEEDEEDEEEAEDDMSDDNDGDGEDLDEDDDDDDEEENEDANTKSKHGKSSQKEEGIMHSEVKERNSKAKKSASELPVNITPLKAFNLVQRIFRRNSAFFDLLYGSHANGKLSCDANMFFLQTLLVAPNRFRPPIHLGEQQFEHPLNVCLKSIMVENEQILELLDSNNGNKTSSSLDSEVLLRKWSRMQNFVNQMIDSTKAEKAQEGVKGVRQELERKEGLMRMNMMGKRVNFACRSVISPDPFMTTGQVGIPEVFAKRLSWPEPVNQYNVKRLRQAVLNGPHVWPGANYVIDERGNKIDLSKKQAQFRTAMAKQLEKKDARGQCWKVGRHLNDGDYVLVNRQPTLHKASLMAHQVKVNQGQRVIRMHYANCKSYNADFDGDEINVHFPQDQFGRAEAACIVKNDLQYIVPTDGSPIRGLIQDHVIAGVQICQLNRMFSQEEYHELVFLMLSNLTSELGLPNNEILTVPPFLLKPVRRWSGKQLITTILVNLLHDVPPINLESPCKVKGNMYKQHTHEGKLVIRGNELLTGVLDKNHIGASAYGLVHAVFEAHGAEKAGLLLTILGRLFTHFQQTHRAFTCGVEDLMVTEEGDAKRAQVLDTANWRTLDSSAKFAEINFEDDCSKATGKELERRRRAVHAALAHLLFEEKGRKLNDQRISQALATVTSGVIDAILPGGQLIPFPENNFEMMTATGAKGSKVNMSQICCLLGQQQLEGQRVPVMASGKTLPCFQPLETDARAGGFVGDRFLTGIRPQEYFFHCMAGREGLVDTAVKTSRSGYLQRCLMKHLESLTVAYDRTVRDNDGGVIQFLYGEDGIDPVRQLGLKWLNHLAENSQAIARSIKPGVLESMDRKAFKDRAKQVTKKMKELKISKDEARRLLPPLTSEAPADRMLGFVSESFEDFVDSYILSSQDSPDAPALLRDGGTSAFKQLAYFKYARSMVQPGEAVGAVAAQSVGEPSTQMTLNTFHSAGQGNATAGIPRLRELIMTASKKPANPMMTLYLKPLTGKDSKETADNIAQQLSRVSVSELINKVEVKDKIVERSSSYAREYEVTITLEKPHMLPASLQRSTTAREALPQTLSGRFCLQMLLAFEREILKDAKTRGLEIVSGMSETSKRGGEEEEGEGEEKQGREDKARDDSEESSEEEEDAENTNAKDEQKKSTSKGYSDADKADRKAMKSSKQSSKLTTEEGDEEGEDDDEGEEKDEGTTGSITLMTMNEREKNKLENMKNKYSVSTQLHSSGDFVLRMSAPVGRKRVMLVQLIEEVAARCIIQELPGVHKCHVIGPAKDSSDKQHSIMTEGVNLDLLALWQLNRQKSIGGALDLNRLRCNDITQVRNVYGVEAARKMLLDEISSVFGAYGIGVDLRHLSLISDAMMYAGEHRPLNRIGMKFSASPLLKMSFETTCTFLTDATTMADSDDLQSPSARLILGRPVKTGTGYFDVRQRMH